MYSICNEVVIGTTNGVFTLQCMSDGDRYSIFISDEYGEAMVYRSSSSIDTIVTWNWLTNQTEIDTLKLIKRGFQYVH